MRDLACKGIEAKAEPSLTVGLHIGSLSHPLTPHQPLAHDPRDLRVFDAPSDQFLGAVAPSRRGLVSLCPN